VNGSSFYDNLSAVYDVMFPLSTQQDRSSFLAKLLVEKQLASVLDCGCGTGRQAIDLALRGFAVTGVDISERMLDIARENAEAAGVNIRLLHSDFAHVARKTGQTYDAVFCIGNSLPHVENREELLASLQGMVDALNNEGILVLHLRNYEMVFSARERLMPTLAGSLNGRDYIFQRFIDFLPDGNIIFNVLTLLRDGEKWKPDLRSTPQYPATSTELQEALASLGLKDIIVLGDFHGRPFVQYGENVIITARKVI
jgi:SAM-dependent methyltransferase